MWRTLLLAGLALWAEAVAAEETCPAEFEKLRFDEDWSCYRDIDDLEGIETLKAINVDSDTWLSLGGVMRQRYEYTRNPAFGSDPQDQNGVWLQRLTLHGDLELGEHVRLFGQLYSAAEEGRAGGPSPVDQNNLTLQNAFVDLRTVIGATDLTIRAGRQELQFGSGRVVDVREGPNVRRSFDALRPFVELDDWRIDGILARPQVSLPGVFDDRASDDELLWGVYVTGGQSLLPSGVLDVYYLGYRNDEAAFAQGTGKETRHSIGARLWGTHAGWDWNWEAIYQFGRFSDGDISAWTVATETGYTFADAPLRPRLALSANVASGDDDPSDTNLGTFNPLFPRGNYFSEAAVLGPRNFWNLHGFLTVHPTDRMSLTSDYNLYWRLETSDGVYLTGLLISSVDDEARFVGSALSLAVEYALTRHIDFTAIYTRFFTGDVIDTAGPSEDISFVELTARFQF